MTYFIHQVLVHADAHMYSLSHIEEGLCRHPELAVQLMDAFAKKFHPDTYKLADYQKARAVLLPLIENLDTGNEINDTRRKNILQQGMNFIDHTLKTNFYRNNKTAFSFRLDPAYLRQCPLRQKRKVS